MCVCVCVCVINYLIVFTGFSNENLFAVMMFQAMKIICIFRFHPKICTLAYCFCINRKNKYVHCRQHFTLLTIYRIIDTIRFYKLESTKMCVFYIFFNNTPRVFGVTAFYLSVSWIISLESFTSNVLNSWLIPSNHDLFLGIPLDLFPLYWYSMRLPLQTLFHIFE